jgi:hypothetical protein
MLPAAKGDAAASTAAAGANGCSLGSPDFISATAGAAAAASASAGKLRGGCSLTAVMGGRRSAAGANA